MKPTDFRKRRTLLKRLRAAWREFNVRGEIDWAAYTAAADGMITERLTTAGRDAVRAILARTWTPADAELVVGEIAAWSLSDQFGVIKRLCLHEPTLVSTPAFRAWTKKNGKWLAEYTKKLSE